MTQGLRPWEWAVGGLCGLGEGWAGRVQLLLAHVASPVSLCSQPYPRWLPILILTHSLAVSVAPAKPLPAAPDVTAVAA